LSTVPTNEALVRLDYALADFLDYISLYEGIHCPETLDEVMPHVRAWFRLRFGRKAEQVFRDGDVERILDEFEEFKRQPLDLKYARLVFDEILRDIKKLES